MNHRAAIVDPKSFGALLRAISEYQGAPETLHAMELLALTFVRPGELRSAEWSEFDFDSAVWAIPGEKMKMRRAHRVPLAPSRSRSSTSSKTSLAPPVSFPLCPFRRTSNERNTINAALRRLGFKQDEMTAHGFRSAASSVLNESGLWNPDAIERQLAHIEPDAVRRAYARADYWDERVRMMTRWADKCEELRRGGELIVFQAVRYLEPSCSLSTNQARLMSEADEGSYS